MTNASASVPALIEQTAELERLVTEIGSHEAYAIDTEFHRERTYYPQLALIQFAWPGGLVLVDPLAVDPEPLAELFRSDVEAVLHAADQDLEVLELAVGVAPTKIFDTQIAAGFLGMFSPSLSAVCERFVGTPLAKTERLTDWLARPLGQSQREYAAADVEHLLEIRDLQVDQLEDRGRASWAYEECEQLRLRRRGARVPEDAWRRIKEARQLKGRARSVCREVASWRERRAARLDRPPRSVLPDLAVVTIAQREPSTADELAEIRGVEQRHVRGDVVGELLEAVRAGRKSTVPVVADGAREIDRELRPAVGLVTAWIGQLARDMKIDAGLLATRNDVEAFLRGDEDARLATGWRCELVGEPVERLVGGDAALAFEGKGRLVLERRAGR